MENVNPPKLQFMFLEHDLTEDGLAKTDGFAKTMAVHVVTPNQDLPGGLYWQRLSLKAFQRRHARYSHRALSGRYKGYARPNFYYHLLESGVFDVDITDHYRQLPWGKGVLEALAQQGVHTFRYFSAWDFYQCIGYNHKTATLRGIKMRIK